MAVRSHRRTRLDAGLDVTVVARGGRPAPVGAELVRADRDHDDAYDLVAGREWDHVVDVSSRADHVRAAVAALGAGAARWTYISSVSAYADDETVDTDETAPLHDAARPGEDDDYGPQKVAAEAAVRTLGDRALIARPGLIVGAGDPSDRFGYWAAAFDRAGTGPVLLPPTSSREAQVIDVDDLAAFILSTRASGAVNAVGDRHPLSEVLDAFRAASGHTGDVVVAEEDALVDRGVGYWAGERSLPLWLPAEMPGFMARSNARYRAGGGGLRPLAETIAGVTADERARGVDRERRAGLTRVQELELLSSLG
jgi:2'-hydroxyisoflavone reductase